MTLTYFDLFYSKVKFSYLGFSMGNVKIVDFSEIISPIDLKEGRSRHLIEFMKVCEIESECHFLTLAQGHVHTDSQTRFSQKLPCRSEQNCVCGKLSGRK